jgi:zinc protease
MKYEDVRTAIRKHLRKDRLRIVVVTANAEDLKKQLVADAPSPMKYNAPKPGDIVKEDKVVSAKKLNLKPDQITILPIDQVFQ